MEQEHFGKILHQISTNNLKQVNHLLKDYDLSMTQGIALVWLEEAEGQELSIKTMEKLFETSQPTTLGVINRLEQKNLVSTHITEKRTKMVKITDHGLNMTTIIKECIEAVEAIVFKDFTQGERILFMELLHKVKLNIS